MKYTALDILKIAGVETPEEKIGKVRVRIGGVPVRKPDTLVNVQDNKELALIVGNEKIDVTLPEEQPAEAVANTKAAHEKRGKVAAARFVKQQRAKAEAGVFGGKENTAAMLAKRIGKEAAEADPVTPKKPEKPQG